MEIYPVLRQAVKNQSGIRLLNVYKGLPISYDAQISSIGDYEIQVHSNRYQLACLYYQQETFLQGDELPFVLRSQVASLNLGNHNASTEILNYFWSPDGKKIALLLKQNPNTANVAVLDTAKMLFTGYCVPVTYYGGTFGTIPTPIWSPDSQQLAIQDWYTEDHRKVLLIDIGQGYAAKIAENAEPVAWLEGKQNGLHCTYRFSLLIQSGLTKRSQNVTERWPKMRLFFKKSVFLTMLCADR